MFWDILSSVAITVLFAVGFGQGRARKAASGWLMTYPLLAKGVASLFSWGFLLLIALSSLNPANRTPRALTNMGIVFCVFIVPSMFMWWELQRRTVLLTNTAIVRILRKGHRTRIAWARVTSVTYSLTWSRYVVTGPGTKIFVSEYLHGQADFARLVLDNVPHTQIQCAEKLQRTLTS